MNAFVNSCAGYVHTYVLGPIVQHLVNKGVQVSVEELAGVLQLPATRGFTPAPPNPATVPAMAFGGGIPITGAVPPMAAAVAPTNSRKTSATNAPVRGRTCMYQFKRGEHKGEYCGKPVAPGSEFCGPCMKTRKNLAKEVAGGAPPGTAPGMGAIPGMAGFPPGYAPPVPATAAAPAGGQLSVNEYDTSRGLFIEPAHNFIVTQVRPGVVVVVGHLSEAENKIVPLTSQQQAIALSIGLNLPDGDNVMPATQAAVTPPHVPTVAHAAPAAIPTIPTGIPNIPMVQPTNNVPALPVIAPLTAQPPIAAPTHGAVTGIPQIPQISM